MKENLSTTSIEPLLSYFNQLILLTKEENELVTRMFRPRRYLKKQYVLQDGDVCPQMNFVVKGCLRMYKIDDSGGTHILQFSSENNWITNPGSF